MCRLSEPCALPHPYAHECPLTHDVDNVVGVGPLGSRLIIDGSEQQAEDRAEDASDSIVPNGPRDSQSVDPSMLENYEEGIKTICMSRCE